ncbi:MAG: hypothetical protein RL391_848 [Actinomycetota bacterium]
MRGFFGHPPLVGAAGRIVTDDGYQGSHPGPSLWIAMLPVYLIGGRSSAALMASVVSVHVASAVVALRLAHLRYGRMFTAALGLVIVLVVRSSGPDFIIEPWNPWLAIIPFLVFLLLIDRASTMEGSRWSLPGAILVGSHCVQCHAGYAILVAGGLLVAVWMQLRRKEWRSIRWSTGVLLAIWLPPLIDQFRREPGNLSILWQHFGSPSEPRLSFGDATRVIATQFNILGPWSWGPGSGHPAESWFRWPGFVLFAALAFGAHRVALRRGLRDEARLFHLLLVVIALAAVSITRLFGPYFEYTIRWAWILTGLVIALAVAVLGHEISRSEWSKRFVGRLGWILITVVFIGTSASTSVVTARDVHRPGPTDSAIVAGLTPNLRALDRDATYLVRFWDPYTLNATGFGVVLEMERSGFTMKVEPSFAAAALPHRTATEAEVDEILWVIVGPRNQAAMTDPTLDRVAYFDPRSSDEQIEADVLLERLEEGLRAAGRDELIASLTAPGASLLFAAPPLPDDVAADLRALYRLGQPVGVYRTSPGVEVPSLG